MIILRAGARCRRPPCRDPRDWCTDCLITSRWRKSAKRGGRKEGGGREEGTGSLEGGGWAERWYPGSFLGALGCSWRVGEAQCRNMLIDWGTGEAQCRNMLLIWRAGEAQCRNVLIGWGTGEAQCRNMLLISGYPRTPRREVIQVRQAKNCFRGAPSLRGTINKPRVQGRGKDNGFREEVCRD